MATSLKLAAEPSCAVRNPNQHIVDYCNKKFRTECQRGVNTINLSSDSFALGAAVNAYFLAFSGWGIFAIWLATKGISERLMYLYYGSFDYTNEYEETAQALKTSPDFVKFAEEHKMLNPESIVKARQLYLQHVAKHIESVKTQLVETKV